MMQCEHIHGNGTRCLTPTLHRRSFCYMHWRQREHKLAVPPEPEFQLPTIDSEASVLLASNQIAHAVMAGTLDTKKARVVVACLKMAVDSLRRMEDVSDITELDLTPAMEQELVGNECTDNVGMEVSQVSTNDVGTEGNDVGTGALARAGGAPAPRSLAASQETHPFSIHPQTPDADLKRFIDQHPLMKLKPPTLAEITGSV